MKKYTKWLRYFFRLVETLVAFILVIVSLGMYLLHDSPMDAQFLMKELDNILLPKNSGYHLQADSIVLGSDFQKEGLIQIEIQDLKLLRPDETIVVSIPQARLAYDFWHLMTLNYVPSTVLLHQPAIDVFLSDEGKVGIKNAQTEAILDENKIKGFIRQLLAFRHVDIKGANLHFQNRKDKKTFVFSNLNLMLAQRFRIRENIHVDSDLTYAGQTTRVLMDGAMNRLTKRLDIKVGFPSVYLKPLGQFLPILSGMDFPVQVSLKGQLNLPKRRKSIMDVIEKLNFQIKSMKAGTLNLPEPLTNVYPIDELEINGLLTQGGELLKMDQSYINLSNGAKATLQAEMRGLKEFLTKGNLKALKTDFNSHVTDIKTNDIGKVWPRGIGTSTHDWVASHLSQGNMPQADFSLHFIGDELVDLYGDLQAQGVKVNYLPPMPPAQNVQARIELFPDTVKIHVFGGFVDSLDLAGTEMLFTDVDIDPSWADVHLKAKGKVRDVFRLLASKPLEFTQEYGIDVDKAQGQAVINSNFFFKLDTESEPDEVKVKTQADIQNAFIVLGDPDIILKNAHLSLTLSNQKMQVEGKTEIFEMPLSIKWDEYFEPEQGLSSKYHVEGNFATTYLKDLYPDIEKFISGQVSLSGDFQRLDKDKTYMGQFQVDTQKAQVNLYPLGETKKIGQKCLTSIQFNQPTPEAFKMTLAMQGKLGQKSEDFDIQGEMLFGKKTSVQFSKVLAPQTELSFSYSKTNSDLNVSLLGKSWNASQILKMPLDMLPDMVTDDIVRNVAVDIRLDEAHFNSQHPIKRISVQGQRQGKNWQAFHAQADLKEPLILIFDKDAKQFQGAYRDFGNLMTSFGFDTHILDGSLTLSADEEENGDIKGKILIQNLKLKDPGFLSQALTVLGVLDAFMGKDMFFDKVEIPTTLDLKNNIFIQDGLAQGTNLGITFKGKLDDNILNIQGSLVPAYAINSLPGKIPVIGWFFKNTEGGGIINLPFTITGTLGNPEFEVHPLGTMKAGFLGNIFE